MGFWKNIFFSTEFHIRLLGAHHTLGSVLWEGRGDFAPRFLRQTRKTKGTKINQLSLNNLKQPKVFAKSSILVVSYCFIVVFVQCPAISYQLSGDIEPNGPFSPFVQKIWWSYGFFLILYRKMVFLGKESKTLRFQRKTRGTCSISFDIHRHYFFYFILTVTYSRLPEDLNIFYSKAQVASGGGCFWKYFTTNLF